MNGEGHGCARTGTFSALLIIKRTPFGPRISNLVGNYEPAGHTDDLGSVIVSDELRTLTLRTQSSRSRTRWDSRYLFQCLSHLVFDTPNPSRPGIGPGRQVRHQHSRLASPKRMESSLDPEYYG